MHQSRAVRARKKFLLVYGVGQLAAFPEIYGVFCIASVLAIVRNGILGLVGSYFALHMVL